MARPREVLGRQSSLNECCQRLSQHLHTWHMCRQSVRQLCLIRDRKSRKCRKEILRERFLHCQAQQDSMSMKDYHRYRIDFPCLFLNVLLRPSYNCLSCAWLSSICCFCTSSRSFHSSLLSKVHRTWAQLFSNLVVNLVRRIDHPSVHTRAVQVSQFCCLVQQSPSLF